jgi:hypothetical protein
MNCIPAALHFLALAKCAADPAAQDDEDLARHCLYVHDFKFADPG